MNVFVYFCIACLITLFILLYEFIFKDFFEEHPLFGAIFMTILFIIGLTISLIGDAYRWEILKRLAK